MTQTLRPSLVSRSVPCNTEGPPGVTPSSPHIHNNFSQGERIRIVIRRRRTMRFSNSQTSSEGLGTGIRGYSNKIHSRVLHKTTWYFSTDFDSIRTRDGETSITLRCPLLPLLHGPCTSGRKTMSTLHFCERETKEKMKRTISLKGGNLGLKVERT